MAKPYKVYFHWKNNSKGELVTVSCDEKNIPGEGLSWGLLSHLWSKLTGQTGLAEAGLTANEANKLHLKAGGFLYMDVGCWLDGNQNFGLICGSEAAVCEYEALKPAAAAGGSGSGLLDQFLRQPGVSVKFREKIHSPQPPDDKHLYLILPDMHVADATFLGEPGDKSSKRDLFHSRVSIFPMIQFLSMVQGLKLAGKITLVQLGDMYELWAERKCKFVPKKPREKHEVELVKGGAQEVGEWIGQTHHHYHELFQAFDRCQEHGLEMLFLYGNHDSYLARPEVTDAANAYLSSTSWSVPPPPDLSPHAFPTQGGPLSKVYLRKKEIDQDCIFIEHGQRCDLYNYDGAVKGFNNANLAAEIPVLKKLGPTERATFVVGAAAKWCVQERDFGIYVMGHTHDAQLNRVEVYHQREGTDYVLGGDGVMVEVTTETPLEGTQ